MRRVCAFREKDQNFVAALVRAGLVDGAVIASRLPTVPERYSVDRALQSMPTALATSLSRRQSRRPSSSWKSKCW
jgi:hypothetical protein